MRECQYFIVLILCFPVGTVYERPEAKTLKEDITGCVGMSDLWN